MAIDHSRTGEAGERPQVPYVSFATFRKLIERMHEEGGPPARIDRSYLSGMSGGYQAQVLVALRTFGLTTEDGHPTDSLRSIAANPDQELIPHLQQEAHFLYPEMMDLAARNGTAAQLAQLFRDKYAISGSTLTGAIRFYLAVSEFAGLPIGKHFKAPKRASRATPDKKTASTSPRRPRLVRPELDMPIAASQANTIRVPLSSGGQIVLTTAVDLMELSSEDRTFVFDLIDKAKAYTATQRGVVSETSRHSVPEEPKPAPG